MKDVRSKMHFFGGLALGMAIYAVHIFFVATTLHGKPTHATWTAISVGFVWPVFSTIYTLVRAWNNPIAAFNSRVAGLGITIALIISVLACLFLSFLIGFSGYC